MTGPVDSIRKGQFQLHVRSTGSIDGIEIHNDVRIGPFDFGGLTLDMNGPGRIKLRVEGMMGR